MKTINPSVEIMRSGLETEPITPEQFIEKVGRTCYKSEDKITDTSAAKFVGNLVKRGHEAMIEHWTLIFKTEAPDYEEIMGDWEVLSSNGNKDVEERVRPHLRFTDWQLGDESRCIISGNMRAWRDFARMAMSMYGFLPLYMHSIIRDYPLFFPEYQDYTSPFPEFEDILIPITINDLIGPLEHGVHHDVTVKFICDRGVSHEIVRHRTSSFAQESTRYCNYSGEKYGREITVILPSKWIDYEGELSDNTAFQAWSMSVACSEHYYFEMLDAGCTPQEARSVLPNSLKTEVIMTTNLNGWDHFFGLRCAPDAHPDIQVVAKEVRDGFWRLFPERYVAFPTNKE